MAGIDDVAGRLAQASGADRAQRQDVEEALYALLEALLAPLEERITARHEAQILALEKQFKSREEVWAQYRVLEQDLALERQLIVKQAFFLALQGELYVTYPRWLLTRLQEDRRALLHLLDDNGAWRLNALLGLVWQENREMMLAAAEVAAQIRSTIKEDINAR